jgi:hypothetical protein
MFGEIGASVDRKLLATGGDLLSLELWLWTPRDPEQSFEIDALAVVEVDAEGLVVAAILFDPLDVVAARAELFERSLASGDEDMPQGVIDFYRGMNEHDLVRVRSGMQDDLVIVDHRHAGMGRLEGADAYIESVAALHELISDARVDILYEAATAANGSVIVVCTAGTNSEGGEVESLFVLLVIYGEEKLARLESFELDQLDAALARFEELTGEPSKREEGV